MSNVVPVLLVELVVRDQREGFLPEHDRFFDRESDSLFCEKKRVSRDVVETFQRRMLTFKNRLYCCRPSCLRCLLAFNVSCKLRMQSGKLCLDNSATMSAVIASPSPAAVNE